MFVSSYKVAVLQNILPVLTVPPNTLILSHNVELHASYSKLLLNYFITRKLLLTLSIISVIWVIILFKNFLYIINYNDDV